MWRTPATSLNASSKAPSTVMSGTIAKSRFEAKGVMRGWDLSSSIDEVRRTETRTRYPAFRASTRTANPTKPVAPVILKVSVLVIGGLVEQTHEDEFSCHVLVFRVC